MAAQACAEQLQGLLDKNSLPDVPEYCRVQATPEYARDIITYAHKLCFTTFAPPGYEVSIVQRLLFTCSILCMPAASRVPCASMTHCMDCLDRRESRS